MLKKICCAMLVCVLAVVSFAGCGQKATPSPSPEVATDAGQESLKVAIVVAAGLGDRSFYDSAASSLDMLTEIGIEGKVLECKEDASLLKEQLIAAAQYADIIVPAGWQFADPLAEIAPEFPDKKFIYVDEAVDGIPNVMSIKYAENQGSYLVGYLGAASSKTGKIGVVGGMDSDTINNFIIGYTEGAKAFNDAITVEKIYAEDYEDPAKGKECALALHGKGCDVIYAVAGKTGNGVFEAAEEAGIYAIGVDSDQKYIKPDTIIASMVKNVGKSIYDAVKLYSETGEFKGGETIIVSLKEECIAVGYGEEGAPQQISDDVKATVKDLEAKILSGEIVVSSVK